MSEEYSQPDFDQEQNPFRSPQVSRPQAERIPPNRTWADAVTTIAGLAMVTLFVLVTVIRAGSKIANALSANFGIVLTTVCVGVILTIALFLLAVCWRLTWTRD